MSDDKHDIPSDKSHVAFIRNMVAQNALPGIEASLANIDSSFRKFNDDSTMAPQDAATHFKPVANILAHFNVLSNMLSVRDPAKNEDLQNTLHILLDKQRDAYADEAIRIRKIVASHADAFPQPVKVDLGLTTDDKEAYIRQLSLSSTHFLIGQIDEHTALAKKLGVQTKDEATTFASAMAAIDSEAKKASTRLHVPQGAMHAFLQLDHTAFFSDVASIEKISNPENSKGNTRLTALLDPEVFADRYNMLLAHQSTLRAPINRLEAGRQVEIALKAIMQKGKGGAAL